MKNKLCMVLYSEWARLFLIVTSFLFGLLWGVLEFNVKQKDGHLGLDSSMAIVWKNLV